MVGPAYGARVRENDSGHRTVGAGAPGDPDRDESSPAAGDDATGRGAVAAPPGQAAGGDAPGDAGAPATGDVVEAVAAFVDDLVEDVGGHHAGS